MWSDWIAVNQLNRQLFISLLRRNWSQVRLYFHRCFHGFNHSVNCQDVDFPTFHNLRFICSSFAGRAPLRLLLIFHYSLSECMMRSNRSNCLIVLPSVCLFELISFRFFWFLCCCIGFHCRSNDTELNASLKILMFWNFVSLRLTSSFKSITTSFKNFLQLSRNVHLFFVFLFQMSRGILSSAMN